MEELCPKSRSESPVKHKDKKFLDLVRDQF